MCRWTNIILAVGLVASLSWPTVFLSPAVMPQSFESLREAQPKGFRHLMLPIDAAKHCLTGEETVARSESSDGRGGQPNLLSVLPGLGWDNLENQERGPTIDRERYTLCRLSSDGSLLIPDDADVGEFLAHYNHYWLLHGFGGTVLSELVWQNISSTSGLNC
ncbi:unnamed protein product [Protopolystoma xenopodis]|uniref:Uncharacterized protein n=1 Tax=Protopolystoma xenopodis TaxID=117903 RepID=A0A3S4ZKJ9_9PLAT|nr:unnamed protein product [Protopolystoma xenopodis]